MIETNQLTPACVERVVRGALYGYQEYQSQAHNIMIGDIETVVEWDRQFADRDERPESKTIRPCSGDQVSFGSNSNQGEA
jgi:hypothetical protein